MDAVTTPSSSPACDLSDRELERLLDQLEDDERRISKRRASLHERIDWLRGGGAGFSPETDEQLETLNAVERQVSDERKALHARIDDLRAEVTRRANAR